MSGTKRIVVGVFDSPLLARMAIESLRDVGFSSDHVGVLTHDENGDEHVKSIRELSGNKAGSGAAIGAFAGAGGGALWALGIAAGVLPAIGPVVAGGLLGAVVASAATGAAGGALAGALTGLGIPDEEAAFSDDEFVKGHTIVVVQGGERAAEATDILLRHESLSRYHSVEVA